MALHLIVNGRLINIIDFASQSSTRFDGKQNGRAIKHRAHIGIVVGFSNLITSYRVTHSRQSISAILVIKLIFPCPSINLIKSLWVSTFNQPSGSKSTRPTSNSLFHWSPLINLNGINSVAVNCTINVIYWIPINVKHIWSFTAHRRIQYRRVGNRQPNK